MKKVLGIIGAGHLGQQIAHFALTDRHYGKIVFFDDFESSDTINGYEIIGKTDQILNAYDKDLFDEILIGIGYNHMMIRKEFFERFENKVPFGKIIHSSSWIDPTANIETGVVIYPGCSVDSNVLIKQNNLINIGCTIAHDTVIHPHCFISPRVALAGFVSIGEQSILGINSTVIDNIKIVQKTQIGGGTVVIKSIEKSGLYVGNPARFIR